MALISNFKEMIEALNELQKMVDEKDIIKNEDIPHYFDLFFEYLDLMNKIIPKLVDEKYIIELQIVIFRRIIAVYVLNKSGFTYESCILIRNIIELFVLCLDISNNNKSLIKWKNDKNGYFKMKNIFGRIKLDDYPSEIRDLIKGDSSYFFGLEKDWGKLSDLFVHEKSRKQFTTFSNNNTVSLFNINELNINKIMFIIKGIIINIINPIFTKNVENIINSSGLLKTEANNFINKFEKLRNEYELTMKIESESTGK